jgi:hypothetical protein
MKTAMQELIDNLKLIEAYPMNPLVLRIATDLLEKEKEQIIQAFKTGYNVTEYDADDYFDLLYNQTYNV